MMNSLNSRLQTFCASDSVSFLMCAGFINSFKGDKIFNIITKSFGVAHDIILKRFWVKC